MQSLGAKLVAVEPGRCVIEAAFRPELSQQHGYFHAGVAGAIADSACGYAAFSLAPPGRTVLSVEYKMNLLAPLDGERVEARAEVLKPGRTLHVCRADVFARKGAAETLCATALATTAPVEASASQPPPTGTPTATPVEPTNVAKPYGAPPRRHWPNTAKPYGAPPADGLVRIV